MYEYVSATLLFAIIAALISEKNNVLVFLFVVLVFFASIKSILVGTDTLNYYTYFIYNNVLSEDHIFQGTQRLWWFFNYCIYTFFNYDVFLIVCYSIAYYGIFLCIKRYSLNYFLSLLLFVLLFFYFSSFNVMRQYIALGIVMLGYDNLIKNKKNNYIYCLIIAALFHFSSIIAFPLLFVEKLKIEKKIIVTILVVASFLLGFIFYEISNKLILSLSLLMSETKYLIYLENFNPDERNLYTNMVINIVFLISYYVCKNKNDFFLKLYFVFIVLSNFLGAVGQGNRLFLYFQISMIFVLPNVYMSIDNRKLAPFYFVFIMIYSIGVFYLSLMSNSGEIIPYSIR